MLLCFKSMRYDNGLPADPRPESFPQLDVHFLDDLESLPTCTCPFPGVYL